MLQKEDLRLKEVIEEEIQQESNNPRDELRKQAKKQILKIQEENRTYYNKKRKAAKTYVIDDLVAIQRT